VTESMSPDNRRDGPSADALDAFVEAIGDALARRYPDVHFVPRRRGRKPPPGSRYLPLAKPSSAPRDRQA
jgi:hypothetical protein